VEVDAETGQVTIVDYVAIDDIGQPINPLVAEGQVHGGIVQGVGQALCESVVFDTASGQLLSGSFGDYAVPRSSDLPELRGEFVEDPTSGTRLRVKGGGESGITPALACVSSAVADALGSEELELPLARERVWQAILAARSAR
jgi:carbon-monoxide dehydrogenase large subunit